MLIICFLRTELMMAIFLDLNWSNFISVMRFDDITIFFFWFFRWKFETVTLMFLTTTVFQMVNIVICPNFVIFLAFLELEIFDLNFDFFASCVELGWTWRGSSRRCLFPWVWLLVLGEVHGGLVGWGQMWVIWQLKWLTFGRGLENVILLSAIYKCHCMQSHWALIRYLSLMLIFLSLIIVPKLGHVIFLKSIHIRLLIFIFTDVQRSLCSVQCFNFTGVVWIFSYIFSIAFRTIQVIVFLLFFKRGSMIVNWRACVVVLMVVVFTILWGGIILLTTLDWNSSLCWKFLFSHNCDSCCVCDVWRL